MKETSAVQVFGTVEPGRGDCRSHETVQVFETVDLGRVERSCPRCKRLAAPAMEHGIIFDGRTEVPMAVHFACATPGCGMFVAPVHARTR